MYSITCLVRSRPPPYYGVWVFLIKDLSGSICLFWTNSCWRPTDHPPNRTVRILWPLTLKFDRVTGLFLKCVMQHRAYRHEKEHYRPDRGHSLNSTCDIKPFKNRHGHFKNSYVGHSHFLSSTCDTGDLLLRAPILGLCHLPRFAHPYRRTSRGTGHQLTNN